MLAASNGTSKRTRPNAYALPTPETKATLRRAIACAILLTMTVLIAFSGFLVAPASAQVLNRETIERQVTVDDVTDVNVTRTVGQQFNLPDGGGAIQLTLNDDGTTSIAGTVGGSPISESLPAILSDLNAGTPPGGLAPPAISVDFTTLPLGTGTFDVASNTVRRNDGQTVTNDRTVPGHPSAGYAFCRRPTE